MDCTTFVARFTDYLDGALSQDEGRAMEEHLVRCGSCMRYKSVVEHGRSVLLSLPVPELGEDFTSRLEHRLFRASEIGPSEEVASRAPALAVLGIAVLLTVVAWAPFLLGGSPVVRLEPIVVDHAPVAPRRLPTMLARQADPSEGLGEASSRIWEDLLLYEYSPLSRRYQETARTRHVGFEGGR
ncbi:MAG: anti-sigma factor [Gemmatimonadales bacterium]